MSELDSKRAMELANLLLIAYGHYESFKETTALSSMRRWRFPKILQGSSDHSYDYHLPHSVLTKYPLHYQVLGEFWHTDRPVGSLLLDTVPFGFCARKITEPEDTSAPPSPEDEIFIVFRGTLNSQEWRNNLCFKKAQAIPGIQGAGYVHSGFNSIFERSYRERLFSLRGLFTILWQKFKINTLPSDARTPSIRRSLESVVFNSELVHPASRIFITGHSLGGALALLAGRVIANMDSMDKIQCDPSSGSGGNAYPKRMAICTFGAPRVGDRLFCNSLKDVQIVRYVNTEDVVPTVPPATSQLLGDDMNFTPEGLREYKRRGLGAISSFYSASAGAMKSTTGAPPFSHVGSCRSFTISQDSISFNHNHQLTYREGIRLWDKLQKEARPSQL